MIQRAGVLPTIPVLITGAISARVTDINVILRCQKRMKEKKTNRVTHYYNILGDFSVPIYDMFVVRFNRNCVESMGM